MAIILGIVIGEIYLEGLNGVTPQTGGHAMTMPVSVVLD